MEQITLAEYITQYGGSARYLQRLLLKNNEPQLRLRGIIAYRLVSGVYLLTVDKSAANSFSKKISEKS